jgi:type III secretory pathway component EscS
MAFIENFRYMSASSAVPSRILVSKAYSAFVYSHGSHFGSNTARHHPWLATGFRDFSRRWNRRRRCANLPHDSSFGCEFFRLYSFNALSLTAFAIVIAHSKPETPIALPRGHGLVYRSFSDRSDFDHRHFFHGISIFSRSARSLDTDSSTIHQYYNNTISKIQISFNNSVAIWLWTGAFVDVAISISLLITLKQRIGGLNESTDSLLRKLIVISLRTAAYTSVLAAAGGELSPMFSQTDDHEIDDSFSILSCRISSVQRQ